MPALSSEPKGSNQQGKPISAATIQQLRRAYEAARQKLKPACRAAGVSRPTGRKYLGLAKLPDLDI